MPDCVLIERDGPVAWLTSNRPEAANRVSPRLVRELQEACEAIHDDREVRAVVLVGAGDDFSGGWDWPSFADESGAVTAGSLRSAGVLDDPFGCLVALPQPVIAALHGSVTGGGLALALAADIRVAAEGATFCVQEADGEMPLVGGVTQRLVRAIGRAGAMAMILSRESLTAADALRLGLVTEVVSRDVLLARANAIASRIAGRGPIAVQFAKEALQRGPEMPLEQALRYETDLTVILQTTQDRAEGVRAFLKKDGPAFKGE